MALKNGFIVSLNIDRKQIQSYNSHKTEDDDIYLKYSENTLKIHCKSSNRTAYIIGDILGINNQDAIRKQITELLSNWCDGQIRNLKGLFYLIIIDNGSGSVKIINSVFSILPVYYCTKDDEIIISSSLNKIAEASGYNEINKQYILEKTLFNYPLFNETPYDGIHLVPSNSYICADRTGLKIHKHLEISSFYTSTPVSWKKALPGCRDLLISTIQNYQPEFPFLISLTGGFDGRTLLSIIKDNPNFKGCYSYGSTDSPDITIPQEICNALGIQYTPVLLEETYAQNQFLKDSDRILINTDGQANISRSHYVNMSEFIESRAKYTISGNFGSEILRAIKNFGIMSTGLLFRIFSLEDDSQIEYAIRNSADLKFLRRDTYSSPIDDMINSVLMYKKAIPDALSVNQKLYIYIFEELFRKYFGPEIVLELPHFYNRCPFLDFEFVNTILQTQLAGANAAFLEKNPLVRFRGQVLYASVMDKMYPSLMDFMSDKGYKPRDFRTFFRKLNIARVYIMKKYIKASAKTHSGYAVMNYDMNRDYFNNYKFNDDLFNKAPVATLSETELTKYQNLYSIDRYYRLMGNY